MEHDPRVPIGFYCNTGISTGRGIKKFKMSELLTNYTRKRAGYESLAGSVIPVIFYLNHKTGSANHENELRGIEVPVDYRSSPAFQKFVDDAKQNVGESVGLDRINRYMRFVNSRINPEILAERDIFKGCIVSLDALISYGVGECAESAVVLKSVLDEDCDLEREGWRFSFSAGKHMLSKKDDHAWVTAKSKDYMLVLDARMGKMYLHSLDGNLNVERIGGYDEDKDYLIFKKRP